jgi:hypothetical protein
VVEVNLNNEGLYFPVVSAIFSFWRAQNSVDSFNGSLPPTIHGFPVPSDPICLSTYVYRNEPFFHFGELRILLIRSMGRCHQPSMDFPYRVIQSVYQRMYTEMNLIIY